MKYTDLEYLVYRHRDMWHWISNQIMKSKRCLDVEDLKEQYIKYFENRKFYATLSCNAFCYLCYLTKLLDAKEDSKFNSCNFCNACIKSYEWKCSGSIGRCLNGLYRDVSFESGSYQYQARIAYKISSLEIDMEKAKQMFGIDKSE